MSLQNEQNPGPRLLLVGPEQRRGPTPANVLGGNTVMMREQKRELAARGFRIDTVDTSGAVTNLPRAVLAIRTLLRFSRVVWQVACKLRKCDAVCSIQRPSRLWDFGAVLWLLCKAFRRPLALRVSGGGFATIYAQSGRRRRWLADRTFMRSDIVYLETRAALDALRSRDNLRYFPNTRELSGTARTDRSHARRLLFLSRIEPEKGLQECLDASRNLPDDCCLSVYGSPATGIDMDEVRHYPAVTYHGVADNAEIPCILAEHDLMLLPTYFATEGLPGVVLEAFQSGMPVVSTRVGGIPELVEHEVSGLLVEPRSATDISDAVWRLHEDPALYRRLCEGARRRGDDYRSGPWHDTLASDLRRIAERRARRTPSLRSGSPSAAAQQGTTLVTHPDVSSGPTEGQSCAKLP